MVNNKHVAILDWELSRYMTNEYYCEKVAQMVIDATNKCVESSKNLAMRNPDDIKAIVDGLLLSGLGIAYTGFSRPASGTEHMVGQTWEIMSLEEGKTPALHGIEVGEATFVAIVMFKRLYNECEDPVIRELIKKYLPAFDSVLALQKTLRLPFTVTEKDKFIEGIHRGRTFRVRYTLLQYLYDRGMLDDYAKFAYDEVMQYNYNK